MLKSNLMKSGDEPRTAGQWIKRIFFAIVALFLIWWLLRVYVH